MSDEPIHERLREEAEREGMLEVAPSELETGDQPIAPTISREPMPARILIASFVVDALGVLALIFVNLTVAVAIFLLSGTLVAVWALARAREAARVAAQADERKQAASGEGFDDA